MEHISEGESCCNQCIILSRLNAKTFSLAFERKPLCKVTRMQACMHNVLRDGYYGWLVWSAENSSDNEPYARQHIKHLQWKGVDCCVFPAASVSSY